MIAMLHVYIVGIYICICTDIVMYFQEGAKT